VIAGHALCVAVERFTQGTHIRLKPCAQFAIGRVSSLCIGIDRAAC